MRQKPRSSSCLSHSAFLLLDKQLRIWIFFFCLPSDALKIPEHTTSMGGWLVDSEVKRIWKVAVVTQRVSWGGVGGWEKLQKHKIGNKLRAIQNVYIPNISAGDYRSCHLLPGIWIWIGWGTFHTQRHGILNFVRRFVRSVRAHV